MVMADVDYSSFDRNTWPTNEPAAGEGFYDRWTTEELILAAQEQRGLVKTRAEAIAYLEARASGWQTAFDEEAPTLTRQQRLSARAETYQRYSLERWGRPLDQETADRWALETIEGGTTSDQAIYERLDEAGRTYWGELVGTGEDYRSAVSPYMASYEQWTGLEADANTEAIQWLRTAPDEERNIAGFRAHVMNQPGFWDTPGGKELERREVMSMAQQFGV